MVVLVENRSSGEARNRAAMMMKMNHFQSPLHSITNEQRGHHCYSQSLRLKNVSGRDESFQREMKDLEDMLFKLNPMAKEFVQPSRAASNMALMIHGGGHNNFAAGFCKHEGNRAQRGRWNGYGEAKRRMNNRSITVQRADVIRRTVCVFDVDHQSGYGEAKKRASNRTIMAQRHETITRTVYVSDIDHQITEQQLAAVFFGCGQVLDCRICGSPNSVLRFAFVEFTDREAAHAATNLSGIVLGCYPLKVFPSKTAIAPVNPTYLPLSLDEREMCARTVYVTDIDKKVSQAQVKLFFKTVCGEVYRLRLLGNHHHPSRIAFVEFAMAECAVAALNCSGVLLGSLPIRVSPSKTPIRPRASHPPTRRSTTTDSYGQYLTL